MRLIFIIASVMLVFLVSCKTPKRSYDILSQKATCFCLTSELLDNTLNIYELTLDLYKDTVSFSGVVFEKIPNITVDSNQIPTLQSGLPNIRIYSTYFKNKCSSKCQLICTTDCNGYFFVKAPYDKNMVLIFDQENRISGDISFNIDYRLNFLKNFITNSSIKRNFRECN